MSSVPVFLSLLTSLALAPTSTPTGNHFAQVVKQQFAAWDLNHDGRIEGREIDTLMTRRAIRGEAAAALAVLKLRERQTPASARPEFTLTARGVDDLDALAQPTVALDKAKGPAQPFHAEARYQTYLKVLQSAVPRLYAGSGPNFSAMQQGPIGDCYFFSITGFLASRHPQKIRQMIQAGPNGNYVVKFLDGESFPVGAPTQAEMLVNNSASSLADGVWLCVLEKAVGKRQQARSKDPKARMPEPTDAMSVGGSIVGMMQLYSGHAVKSIQLRDPEHAADKLRQLRHELPATLAQGRMASVGMREVRQGFPKVPGLGYGHAYAILEFDQQSDRVTVWNPWGNDFQPKGAEGPLHGFVTKHGVFHIPLVMLYRHFSAVHLQTTERVK